MVTQTIQDQKNVETTYCSRVRIDGDPATKDPRTENHLEFMCRRTGGLCVGRQIDTVINRRLIWKTCSYEVGYGSTRAKRCQDYSWGNEKTAEELAAIVDPNQSMFVPL